MEIDVDNLPDSPELLRKIIFDIRAEASAYKEKYHNLLEEIRLAKNHRFSPSSEKNILQADLFDEPGIELSEEVKEHISDDIDVKSYTRSKNATRHRLPAYLPREVILHDIPEAEKICGCGAHLTRIGEEITEQIKYIPAKLNVIQHVRPKYACKPCQENIKIAVMPKLLLPKSIATPELMAHIIISKYSDHIPLYRQESIWQRMEIDLPRNSLCGWIIKVAELCAPLIRQLQKQIIDYDYVQVDETTVQVLNEVGRANTAKSYMWCYRGGGVQPSIIYDYQETRGGYHAQVFLSGFNGYLQSDAYSGYNWVENYKNIIAVGCHAHARRPFAEIIKITRSPGLASDAIKFYRKLYAIEKEARENNLSSESRHILRQEKSIPVLNAFKEWLDHHLIKTSEQAKIGKAIRYCLSNWTELTSFLKDGRIEIDNNLIENAIRPFALGRKNWLFAGSPAGAKAGAILYSLIETCKANNIEPYKYFCNMLNQIRDCITHDDYKKLLPQFIGL